MSSDEASRPSAREQEPTKPVVANYSLEEYIDEFRDELEAIAEESHVISPLVQTLLERHGREERQC